MSDPISDSPGKSKADAAADAINRLLQNLGIKAATQEGVRNYFDVGVIGYGSKVGSAFTGSLKGKDLVPLSQLANSPARVEQRDKKEDDGAGGAVTRKIKFPVWFDAVADNGTPMSEALRYAHRVVQDWLPRHQSSYPPTIINITDGASTDGDPETAAQALRQLSTTDGAVLLFNCHLSDHPARPIEFPDSESDLPADPFAKALFRMSSILPSTLVDAVKSERIPVNERSRGYVFNAELVTLIKFLDIGTRPAVRGFLPAANR